MKTRFAGLFCLLIGLLTFAASWAFAEGEDPFDVVHEYPQSYLFINHLMHTIVLSAAYLLIFAGVLVVTLSYLHLFTGFDESVLLWIALLWLGGLAINVLAFHITPSRLPAILIAAPLTFGWSLLLGTRSFADLLTRDALRVSLIVALICAPYFGPIVQLEKVKTRDEMQSRLPARPALTVRWEAEELSA